MIGSRAGDPADLYICTGPSYIALPVGLSIYDWDSPERTVPAPPPVENGPFTELRLAPSPAAAVFGLVRRRRHGSSQSVLQVLRDAQRAGVYRVEAPGVRIKDRHADSRLVDGVVGLRKEGELALERLDHAPENRERVAMGAAGGLDDDSEDRRMSEEWATFDACFNDTVAAVQVPDDSELHAIKTDWPLVGSSPRLEALGASDSLTFVYLGKSVVRLRDLLWMRDVHGRWAGWRFVSYIAGEIARDLFSIRRKGGLRDWLKFGTALLGAVSGLASLSWLLSLLVSSLA